ncbi:hypothetical protein [Streptomyces lunaelactis]|nr:hypothetical protein [Streptomyces lunaelactis]NUK02887.1 hypothetical protein [Streptomyces lunaelactis]NUK17042.1 hypothetical protein [Streptomyces lunaelactis]
MKKNASIISGVTLALAAGALALAPGAAAGEQVGNCHTSLSSRPPYTGTAYCSGMAWGDRFRVKLTCIDPRGSQWLVYGPWKKNDSTSTAKCSDNPNVGIYKAGWAFNH